MNDLFISYNWDNKDDVQKIIDLLKSKNGYQIWLDDNVMSSGDILHGEIKNGIDNSKLFVAFITKKYCESKSCQLEIKYAFEKNKNCIYVMLDKDLGSDPAGISLLVAGSLRLNAYDYVNNTENWHINLYKALAKDVDRHLNDKELPKLIDLEVLITCRVCNDRFNLENISEASCRKPIQTNCNTHNIHQNVLCLKCVKDRKKLNSLGNEEFLCPFDGNGHSLVLCTDAYRLHNIIRYFETQDYFRNLKNTVDNYETTRNRANNEIIYKINESKSKIKERVEEVLNQLNNYLAETIQKLDKHAEEWSAKQEAITAHLKTNEILKLTEESLSQLENDLIQIEVTVKRNSSNIIDTERVNQNVRRIESINDEMTMLNSRITEELEKLKDEMGICYKKECKIHDYESIIGVLNKQKLTLNEEALNSTNINAEIFEIRCEIHTDEFENKIRDLENENSVLLNQTSKLQKYLQPKIDRFCDTKVNNFVEIKELIELNMENTVLMKASENGHFETVKFLIENGACINEKDKHGFTALMKASENDHFETVKFLIENGACINEKDKYGHTALMKVVSRHDLKLIKFLIENGANVNEKTNYNDTALIMGICQLETVKLLIQNGANINDKGNHGCGALYHALSYNRTDVVNYLKSNGAI